MLKFHRETAGFYTARSGRWVIRKTDRGWDLASPIGDATGFGTLRAAVQFARELLGDYEAESRSPVGPIEGNPEAVSTDRAKSTEGLISVYRARDGLCVYGTDLAPQDVPNATERPGKYGKPGGLFVPHANRADLWQVLRERFAGRTLRTVAGHDRTEQEIPAL